MSLQSTPIITIAIVNWNGKDKLRECLLSLANQTFREFRVLVVDNNSTDGSVEMLREHFPEVQYYVNQHNLGFAEACNQAIAASQTPWVLILNNDTIVDQDALRVLHETIKHAGPDLGMIQPKILFMNKRDFTNSTGIIIRKNGTATDRDFDCKVRDTTDPEEIFCPTAGAAIYRREMLEQVKLDTGYFDKSFFMYWEDVDLGWRCRLAGWRAMYVPSAVVYHTFQHSSSQRGKRFVSIQCRRNRMLSLIKNASATLILRSGMRTLVDVIYLARWAGLSSIVGLVSSAQDALQQRSEIARISRVKRRSLERQWLT